MDFPEDVIKEPFIVYPHAFPCRVNEVTRFIHCDSCEIVPGLLDKIARLEKELDGLKKEYSDLNILHDATAKRWARLERERLTEELF